MRKVTTFIAMMAVTANLAAPVYAADVRGGGMFNPTTVLGWRQTNSASAMAYFHMPFTAEAATPRIGLRVAGPAVVYPGQSSLHLDGPRVFDFSLAPASPLDTAHALTATLTLGNSVAWSSDRTAVPGNAPHLFDSGLSWVAVGLLSAGAIVGAFALTNRKQPAS